MTTGMRRRNRQARCVRCGYTGPLRAFEVEVALSADDSGDNDWVINYSCPDCESAERPDVLAGAATAAADPPPDSFAGAGTAADGQPPGGAGSPRPPASLRPAAVAAREALPSGP